MRKVQLTIKQEEVAPATTSDLVVMNNGRTLKEELSTNVLDKFSREVTVDSAMSKVIDGTLDGVYESGVMYGRTLVNSIGTLGNFRKYSDIYFYCDTKGLIKPSAKYYYQIKNLPSNCRFCIGNSKSSTETFFSYQAHSLQGTVTTKTTQPDESVRVWIYRVDDTTNDLVEVLNEIELVFIEYQEGMENWDISFFEGICDVKMPALRNVGKNLFDGEWEAGQYDISGSKIDNYLDVDIRSKNYISVKPNKTYVLSNNGVLRATHVREYNINHEIVATHNAVSTFTTTSNTHYITGYGAKENRDKFQIEESSTATPYENHKTNILHTSEEIVLREVGGVQDTYNLLTGEYTQRIGEEQFCGDGLAGYAENETYSGAYYLHSNSTSFSPLLSPTMKNLTETEWKSMSCEGIYKGSSGMGVVVNTSKLSQSNLTGLKAYFTQNPVTFQYQLAEPITTIVEPSTIPFAYENGHIILESGFEGQSLLPELKYSAPASKNGVISTTSKAILKHEQRLHKFEDLLLRESILMDYRLTLSFLDKM